MKRLTIYFLTVVVLISGLMVTACDDNSTSSDSFKEPTKSLKGSYKIYQVMRNDEDITSQINFEDFRINFDKDNTFAINHFLPFAVNDSSGTWSFDNPQRPFKVTFEAANNSSDSFTSELRYPIVNGKRNIVLTFTPGCSSIEYTYRLQPADEELIKPDQQ